MEGCFKGDSTSSFKKVLNKYFHRREHKLAGFNKQVQQRSKWPQVGVLNPRNFLGRWFKVDSIYIICSSDSLLKSALLVSTSNQTVSVFVGIAFPGML